MNCHKIGKYDNVRREFFFNFWITFHYEEFQSAVIGKKIEIELKWDVVHDKLSKRTIFSTFQIWMHFFAISLSFKF